MNSGPGLINDVIAAAFGGDSAAYEKAKAESYREIVSWHDIEAAAETFPELEKPAHLLIEELLGYLPPHYITLPYEPFLRSLLHNFEKGSLLPEKFLSEAEACIKPMRNKEMLQHCEPVYDEAIISVYNQLSAYYREAAKSRIKNFLGYEPEFQHSVAAELLLTGAMLSDGCYLPEKLTNTDLQVITIIKYREVLLRNGKAAADASPLIATDLKAQHLFKE